MLVIEIEIFGFQTIPDATQLNLLCKLTGPLNLSAQWPRRPGQEQAENTTHEETNVASRAIAATKEKDPHIQHALHKPNKATTQQQTNSQPTLTNSKAPIPCQLAIQEPLRSSTAARSRSICSVTRQMLAEETSRTGRWTRPAPRARASSPTSCRHREPSRQSRRSHPKRLRGSRWWSA